MQDPVKIYEDAKAAERAAAHPILPFTEFAKIAHLPKRKPLTPEQKVAAKQRWRKWAAENRDKLNASTRAYRKRRYAKDGSWRDTSPKSSALRAWMIELKSKPCTDCGGTFEVCCMDFDHVGTEKGNNVGSMFAHHYSREAIEIELAKCELVCANCHRVRTRNRRTGSGTGGRGR